MTPEALRAAGIALDPPAMERLSAFVASLLEENTRLNLTAIRAPDAAWVLHVLDSLALLPLLDRFEPRSLVDIGTGGGLPGVPLACVRPALRVLLVDATRKKIDAVQRICAAVGLTNTVAQWGRAEQLGHDPAHRERYDAATSRATGQLAFLLEFASGFLRVGGKAWFFKSERQIDEELRAAKPLAAACGMMFERLVEYRLPGGERDHGARVIAAFSKVAPLRPSFPRSLDKLERLLGGKPAVRSEPRATESGAPESGAPGSD